VGTSLWFLHMRWCLCEMSWQAWFDRWAVTKEGPGRGWWGPPAGTHGPGSQGGSLPGGISIRNPEEFTSRGFAIDKGKIAEVLPGWSIEIVGNFPTVPSAVYNVARRIATVIVGYQGFADDKVGLLAELNYSLAHELRHLASLPDRSEDAADAWAKGKKFVSRGR